MQSFFCSRTGFRGLKRNEFDRFDEQNLVKAIAGVESDVDYEEEIDSDGAKAVAKIQEAVAAFK